uniref:BTB domain-containing protein n=1 Tax=Panagrellus redivivus TaxID=6233 RepID=A0A7E4VNH5_PANRE
MPGELDLLFKLFGRETSCSVKRFTDDRTIRGDWYELLPFDAPYSIYFSYLPAFVVPNTTGFEWKLRLGTKREDAMAYDLLFTVGQSPVRVKGYFYFNNDVRNKLDIDLDFPDCCRVLPNFFDADFLDNQKPTMHCHLEFTLFKRQSAIVQPMQLDELIDEADNPRDVQFVIGDKIVRAHRSILTTVSPVFRAMFNQDMIEARTNRINIVDFTYETIRGAIDSLYGKSIDDASIDTVIGMAKFARKYELAETVVQKLEKCLEENLQDTNVCAIAAYAWEHEHQHLRYLCSWLFRDNHGEITMTDAFQKLDRAVAMDLIYQRYNSNNY